MVVLGEGLTKDTHVSSIQVAATGDGGGGHVVADHGVHVPRRLHRGETVEEPFLRAFADHLSGGAHDRRCGSSCGGGRCIGGTLFARSVHLLRDRCYLHHSRHRLVKVSIVEQSDDATRAF